MLNNLNENDKEEATVTEETLNINNLSEYAHAIIGEASTLFYRNKDHVFDDQAAIKLAERLIKGFNRIIEEVLGKDGEFAQMVRDNLGTEEAKLYIKTLTRPMILVKGTIEDDMKVVMEPGQVIVESHD